LYFDYSKIIFLYPDSIKISKYKKSTQKNNNGIGGNIKTTSKKTLDQPIKLCTLTFSVTKKKIEILLPGGK